MRDDDWGKVVVETDSTVAEVGDDGRLHEVPRLTIPDEWVDMVGQGYRCANCLERQPHAFPVECLLCGFAMKAKQAQLFERMFGGRRFDPLGASIDGDAEMEAMERRRFDRERREGLRARGIFVPGHD